MDTAGCHTIGDRIRQCRKDKGLSQEALAEILYMKKSTISKYENDSRDIPASTIVNLAKALDTSPNYLLLGTAESTIDDVWVENVFEVLKKISTPYRELALKQLKCIADITADN